MDVPTVLLTNDNSISDITELKAWLLWNKVYPNKLYDKGAALKLQRELRLQRQSRLAKQVQERVQERAQSQKELESLCAKIAEVCFIVDISADSSEIAPVGEVSFDTKIRDVRMGKVFGTIRDLLASINLEWACGHADPRVDLAAYLEELEKSYNGFSYPFAFERRRESSDAPIKFLTPSDFEIPKYATFRLHLSWRSFTTAKIAKKFGKLLKTPKS